MPAMSGRPSPHSRSHAHMHGTAVPQGVAKASRSPPREHKHITAPKSGNPPRPKNVWLKNAAARYSALKKELPSREWAKLKETHFNHARFISDVSEKLRLQQLPKSTAITFFALYNILEKNSQYSPFIMSLACLFLAAKVEESARKCSDILAHGYALYHKQRLVVDSSEYSALMQDMLDAEVAVLMKLGFDLEVEHAYTHVIKIVDTLKRSSGLTSEQSQALAKNAWTIVNDSFHTMICLQFSPKIIGVTAVYMAARGLGLDLIHPPSGSTAMSPQTPQSPYSPGESPQIRPQQEPSRGWWHAWQCNKQFIEDAGMQIAWAVDKLKHQNEQQRSNMHRAPSMEFPLQHTANHSSRDQSADADRASSPVLEPGCPASRDPSPSPSSPQVESPIPDPGNPADNRFP